MTDLKEKLRKHKLWLDGEPGGERFVASGSDLRGVRLIGVNLSGASLGGADLSGASLGGADLRYAYLRGSNLSNAYLRMANLFGASLAGSNLRSADLSGADLSGSDLSDADLCYTNFIGSNLSGSNLIDTNLSGADLRCYGDMKHIKTMQIGVWTIGYTHDTLQIGCQRHAIDKWRKWDTEAGRKWIASMDSKALEWADRNLALVLQIIDANLALPTKEETND